MPGDLISHDIEGGGDGGGVALPLFGGTLVEDWPSHQLRLEAWFRIRSISLDSPQATDCLLLSLRGYAALVYQRLERSERSTYEKGVGWLTNYFVNETRTRLMRTMAHKKLVARTYREKGRRGEFVMDMVQELEVLFFQAGIHDQDGAKRRAFIQSVHCLINDRCFNDYAELKHRLELSTTRYAEAIDVAMQWESTRIGPQPSISEAKSSSSTGNDKATATSASSISSQHSSFFGEPEYKKLQSFIAASRPESTSSPKKNPEPYVDAANELFLVSTLLDEQGECRPSSSVYFSDQLLSSRSLLDLHRPLNPLQAQTTSPTPLIAHLVPGPLARHSREHLVVVGADREERAEGQNRGRASPAASAQFSIGSLPSEIRHSIQSSQHGIIVVSEPNDDRSSSPTANQGVNPDRRSDSRVDQEHDDYESTGLQLDHATISPLNSVATASIPGSLNSSFIQEARSSNRSFELSSYRLPFLEFDEPKSLGGLDEFPTPKRPYQRSTQQQTGHGRSQSAVEFYYGSFGSHDIEGLSINRSVVTESDLPSNDARKPHPPSLYDSIANEIVGGVLPTEMNNLADLPGGLQARRMSYPGFTSLGGEKAPLVRSFRFPMFEASTPVIRLCEPDGEGEGVEALEVGTRRDSEGDSLRPLERASDLDRAQTPVTTPTQDMLRPDLFSQPTPSLQPLDPQQSLKTRQHRSLYTMTSNNAHLQSSNSGSIARHRHVRGTPRKLAKPGPGVSHGITPTVVVDSPNPHSGRGHKHVKTMSLDRNFWRLGGGEGGKEGRSPKSSGCTIMPIGPGGKRSSNSSGWKGLWGRWFHPSLTSSKNEAGEQREQRGFHGPLSLYEGKDQEEAKSPRLPEMIVGGEMRHRDDSGEGLEELVEDMEDVHGGEGRPAKERRGLMMMETRF
ncbi:BZ3500_MvSof-1268-A1-R1_Chr9g10434 [Microbotryum saponariae]|uniref:BZ3500_MvSof-1268-A1-R1_Chr9g10434 protein n=1 Tax=Microbotryum saponariae TaxID=289078 RepID=A0A2X0KDD0_9BASI|nr:BZ3501_MvSof-1269-A2-R1_Chr9g10184 [Microbotryum saponariae]SDA00086.1 BZ3500_MvSof-1268-A1-R1_Chr9g10434 [Microbotryum saponariae]